MDIIVKVPLKTLGSEHSKSIILTNKPFNIITENSTLLRVKNGLDDALWPQKIVDCKVHLLDESKRH